MAPNTSGDLGSILGIWGHPDDEAYLSAGLMATAVDAGRAVTCVTATRGEKGFPDDDPRPLAERAAVREAELKACLDVLGVTDHRWLDYADGACHEVDIDGPVAELCEILEELRPDTVLTFGPDGQTGHVDHIAVGRWTTLAFERVAPAGAQLLYATKTSEWNDRFVAAMNIDVVMMVEGMRPPTTEPGALAVHFEPDVALLERKVKALRCQASQVEPLIEQAGLEPMLDLTREEFFRTAVPGEWG